MNHEMDLIEGIDYTIDANGKLEYSTGYLSRLGYCCALECRNCPYVGKSCPKQEICGDL